MKLRKLGLALLVTTCSLSSFARVSIQEKENRVQFLEKIGVAAPSLSIDAYKRELEYERQGLPLQVRASNEARLLAEMIQDQILHAYERAMNAHGDAQKAGDEVREAINADLELAAPEFKKELHSLAMQTLNEIEHGGIVSYASRLTSLESVILPNVQDRSRYLNEEVMDASVPQADFVPASNAGKDAEKLSYKSYPELVESLVSDRPSTRWVSTANKSMSSSETTTKASRVSYQLKIDFLGVSLEAGPTIDFLREYSTSANIMAEELNPILTQDGHFDVHKRDTRGKIIHKNGKAQRRFLAFYCTSELRFSTDYKGSGGFSILGIGGETSVTTTFANTVSHHSRRILVPDHVGGETLTLSRLAKLCHKEFLDGKLNSNLTVQKSLNIEMKNLISGLRFSHPRTNCSVDGHCVNWFNNEILKIWTYATYPRCVEEKREKFHSCKLRGLEKMGCRVYKNQKLISSGKWELDCDKGLKCVQYKSESWNSYAKGRCEPVNRNTYRDPKKYPEYERSRDFIMVNIRNF